MTSAAGPGMRHSIVVASRAGEANPPSSARLPLRPGHPVSFRVLPGGASGTIRIRIGSHLFSAATSRPLPEGATLQAVVRRVGPPLLLQILEPEGRAKEIPAGRIALLTGRRPVGEGLPFSGPLRKWNDAMAGPFLEGSVPVSPGQMREAIQLARFLAFALAHPPAAENISGRRSFPAGEKGSPKHPEADPAVDPPSWFFVPLPGEGGPRLFPGSGRKRKGRAPESWEFFLRLPEVGAVSAAFFRGGRGWRIHLRAERKLMVRVLSAGLDRFAGEVRGKGIPLEAVTVARMPEGRIEGEAAACLAAEWNLRLVDRTT
ncbi:MAG: hypothetical protein Kow00128_00400 [Deltaproteobacteria bacterium]